MNVVINVSDSARLGEEHRRSNLELVCNIQNPREEAVVDETIGRGSRGGKVAEKLPQRLRTESAEGIEVGLGGLGRGETAVVVTIGDGEDGERRKGVRNASDEIG